MGIVNKDEIISLSVEELGHLLQQYAWYPINNELVNGEFVGTVYSRTFTVYDFEGLDEYVMYGADSGMKSSSNVLVDPTFMTYELDIVNHSGYFYFWTLGENPGNADIIEDFFRDDETFADVVYMILEGTFAKPRECGLSEIWNEKMRTCLTVGDIPIAWLSLLEAKTEWVGYAVNADEKTVIEVGDVAIKYKVNSEDVPDTYVLISKDLARKVMNASEEEARELMKYLVNLFDEDINLEVVRELLFSDEESREKPMNNEDAVEGEGPVWFTLNYTDEEIKNGENIFSLGPLWNFGAVEEGTFVASEVKVAEYGHPGMFDEDPNVELVLEMRFVGQFYPLEGDLYKAVLAVLVQNYADDSFKMPIEEAKKATAGQLNKLKLSVCALYHYDEVEW